MTIDWNKKTILVTGGTGSFGQTFVRTMVEKFQPKKIIVFSRDEMKQYEMKKRLEDKEQCVRYFIGDVRDASRLHRAFHDVDIVVHAAAIKIVPTAEYNPIEAVRTNVMGAENIINMAIDNEVEQVVMLSTDKAANPINLYGATKLCAEKMFIAANNYSPGGTKFSVVRYGNVFGSRGSVVPFFLECRNQNVVPITDERMTRFWITLDQGVDLVLKALYEMQGGEIYVPKLPSIKIVDLAEAICPGIKHEIVGIRPGEKLHETLLPMDDWQTTYETENHYVTYAPIIPKRPGTRKGRKLSADFKGYRSDNNDQWFNIAQLQEMLNESGIIHAESNSLRASAH